jgi:hypothetical protein
MADHNNMVKFSSGEDGGFRKVSGHLLLMARDCAKGMERNCESQGAVKQSK